MLRSFARGLIKRKQFLLSFDVKINFKSLISARNATRKLNDKHSKDSSNLNTFY